LALKIRQEISSELSFILVSGMLGEEVAIESLMSGATDYVKNRLERLIPAVCCAIHEAEERTKRRRAEEERERLLIRERMAENGSPASCRAAATPSSPWTPIGGSPT
jgi:FixJ family two-component response regulator